MHSLSIFFGPSPVLAQFLFKNEERAAQEYMRASQQIDHATHFSVADDFGQQASFAYATIHAAILEDMDLGEESRIQRGLSQARGQANANKRAQSDPVLQAASRGQGPSVLTPFGRNGFNG